MRVHAAALPVSGRLFTWLGAALFCVSLAYCALSYVTTFGLPAAGRNRAPAAAWNVMLFTLFAVHHSVCARERVRRWVTRLVPAPIERSVYVWIASLLLIAVCGLWRPVPGVAWDAEGTALWSLRLLQATGVWLSLRSVGTIGVRELAGVTPVVASRPEFKNTGPYGWVRHPLYSGWFLMVLAAAPMTMTRLVFAAVSCAYLLIAIPFEERSMRAAGTGAYERYVAQVRWRLVPGVY